MAKQLKDPESYHDDELVSLHVQWPGLNVKLLNRIAIRRDLRRAELISIAMRAGLLAMGYKEEAALWRDPAPAHRPPNDDTTNTDW